MLIRAADDAHASITVDVLSGVVAQAWWLSG
jgi:hypothetical protein